MNKKIVIVGASLAGCSTAILLARAGHQVILVDRSKSLQSFKRVCTHLIQNAAIPTLQRLGLLEKMIDAGARASVLNIWFRSQWVRMNPESKQDAHGPTWNLNLRREVLDPMVRELAMSTPGIETILGASLESLAIQNGRVSGIKIVRDGIEQTIPALLVIGADGRFSKTASLAQIPSREFENIRGGWGAYYRNVRLNRCQGNDTQFWLLEPDIAYAFPTDNGLTLLAAITTQEKLGEWKQDIEFHHRRALEQLPDGPDLSHAERVSEYFGMIKTHGYYRNPNSKPGMTLVGDAALTTDFVWGDGCSFAFRSAEMLADAIGPQTSTFDHRSVDAAINKYQKRHARVLYHSQYQNSRFSKQHKLDWIRTQVFQAAGTSPKLQQLMFEVQTGRVDGTSGGIKLLCLSILANWQSRCVAKVTPQTA